MRITIERKRFHYTYSLTPGMGWHFQISWGVRINTKLTLKHHVSAKARAYIVLILGGENQHQTHMETSCIGKGQGLHCPYLGGLESTPNSHGNTMYRPRPGLTLFLFGEKRHWDPARIRIWVLWSPVRCSYQWTTGALALEQKIDGRRNVSGRPL